MKRIFIALLVGATVLAGGCAAPLEVASITPIRAVNGSTTTDIYAQQRSSGDVSVPEFAGDQLVEVRAYEHLDGKGQVEMAGATCDLSAGSFSATMQTPAKVRVPLYRQRSETLAVKCGKAGYHDRMVTLKPFDFTRAQRYNTANNAGASGGLIGGLAALAIAGAVDAASDNTRNDWRYPKAKLTLQKMPEKTTGRQIARRAPDPE